MALNDDIHRDRIRRRALVTMYEMRLAKELDDQLVNLNRRFVRMARSSRAFNATLTREFNREIRRTYRRIYNMALDELNRLYHSEAAFNASLLNRSLRNIYDARRVPSSFSIRDLFIRDNKNLAMHLGSISAAQRTVLSGIIRRGVADELTNEQIIGNIQRRATKLTRLQVSTLTRTAVTEVTNSATNRIYDLNDDVIRGYQYVATLDGRTSIICARLDGRVFSLDSGYKPQPPQHFNCRSTTIPIVKSVHQLMNTDSNRINKTNLRNITDARRASINGQVPARLTYPEWLSTQDNEIKLNLLGSQSRVNLFDNGSLRLTQFSSVDGKLLSLERLEELSNR